MTEYNEFRIKINPFEPEIISGLLWNLEIEGLNENENSISIFVDSLKINFEKQLRDLLNSAIENQLLVYYEIEKIPVENKNWNEEWEKNLKIIEVSDRVVIKPTFRDYENSQNKIVINLNPKMSFGTGEHETTKLMIRAIEKHINTDDYVLDAGTGTGILAIAAIKLGAKKAIGFDIDEWCKINGEENKQLNDIAKEVDIVHGDIDSIKENNFDLVLANINTHILIEEKEKLFEKIKHGGKLVLSGLLNSDVEKIIYEYSQLNLTKIEEQKLNEWSLLVFNKN